MGVMIIGALADSMRSICESAIDSIIARCVGGIREATCVRNAAISFRSHGFSIWVVMRYLECVLRRILIRSRFLGRLAKTRIPQIFLGP
jgi:hypothetical protein